MLVLAIKVSAWSVNNSAHIEEYIIYVASKEGVDVTKALAVARCESRLNPLARNTTNKEDSIGVFQINTKVHKDITVEEAQNPFRNINWAMEHLIQGKWWMWKNCYDSLYRTS